MFVLPPGFVEFIAWLGLLINGVWVSFKARKHELGLKKVAKSAEKAAAELTPNHGSSTKDSLARIEAAIKDIKTEQNLQSKELKHNTQTIKILGHQLGEHVTVSNAAFTSQEQRLQNLEKQKTRK